MRIHVLQHVPFEGLGAIEDWLVCAGATVSFTRFFAGDALPPVDQVDGVIVMGGPMSVHDARVHPWLDAEKAFLSRLLQRDVPLLGICLGAQLLAEALGAHVTRNPEREIGWFPVTRVSDSPHPLADCFPSECTVFHWHGETFSLPPGAIHLLRSAGCENQGFAFGRRVLGLQFHLETTPAGAAALVENARDEMIPGRFVQTEAEIVDRPAHQAETNAILHRVLARLFV